MAQRNKNVKAPARNRPSPSDVETRKNAAEALILGFNIEWVTLLAGGESDYSHMAPELATRIRAAVEPFLAKGDRVLPKFDPYAQVRLFAGVDDLVDGSRPIKGEVELTSRCEWSTRNQVRLQVPPQRITIQFTMDGSLTRMLTAKFSVKDI
jgi:hypothetical protein